MKCQVKKVVMVLSIYSEDSFNSSIQHRLNVLLREVFPSSFFLYYPLTCKHHTQLIHQTHQHADISAAIPEQQEVRS